jgi:hypothetical protein
MHKTITILSWVLLLLPAVTLADRPAMAERDLEQAPMAEENPPPEMREVPPEMREKQVVTGDALELKPGETITINHLDFPRRGMDMQKVRNELGEPLTMSAAIGDPPITSWGYTDRIVYFEYSKVIHVVPNR